MSTVQDINKLTSNRASTFEFTQEDAENILIPSTFTDAALLTDDLTSKLERLQQKDARLILHGSMLSEYWRNKRIPRGLRIQKAPTLVFMQRWTDILNKCSLDLMLLIIEQVKKELNDLQAEIKHTEDALKSKCGQDFTQIDQSLKTWVGQYKDKLQSIKLSKYKRDTLDYQRNKVYRWQQPEEQRTQQRQNYISSGTESEYPDSDTSLNNQQPFLGHQQQGQRSGAEGGRSRPRNLGRSRGRAQTPWNRTPTAHNYPTRHSNR